jgi:hypothetical protein
MLRRMSMPLSSFTKSLAATAVLFTGGLAHAGVTIETTRGAESAATMYLEGERMRIDGADKTGTATSVIIDGGGKKLIVVEEKKKSYTELTESDMKRMKVQVDAMRAQMEERMKTMPPEQRKQVEAMMAGMGGAPGKPAKPAVLKFEKLGQKKTINGFSCEMYRVLKDGVASEEDCIAAWSASTVQKSDLAGLRKFGEEMMKNFGSAGARDQIQLDQLDKYPGIPISRVPLEADGTRGPEEQIKSIKRGSVPAAKFAVPAGYTKKTLPTGMGAGGPPAP